MTPGLIFISGSSGAGKSSALRLLEDEGYYCVDNLPPRLLPQFSEEVLKHPEYDRFRGVAVCIDARTIGAEESAHTEALERILSTPGRLILFLDAQPHALLKRFSETRRRHPLAGPDNSLPEAIARERRGSNSSPREPTFSLIQRTNHALFATIVTRIIDRPEDYPVLLESFAFKRGVPTDSLCL